MDEAPEVRQFDFWLGRWDVFGSDGTHVGTNHITPLLGGPALAEHWEGDGGVSGVSPSTPGTPIAASGTRRGWTQPGPLCCSTVDYATVR